MQDVEQELREGRRDDHGRYEVVSTRACRELGDGQLQARGQAVCRPRWERSTRARPDRASSWPAGPREGGTFPRRPRLASASGVPQIADIYHCRVFFLCDFWLDGSVGMRREYSI